MDTIKTMWWFIVTVLLMPIAAILLSAARTFEWLGEQCQKLFDWFVDEKHKFAPPPPYKIPKSAEDDL